ncbi:MAG: STAS-like domain-containing protein [Smithella sp.]
MAKIRQGSELIRKFIMNLIDDNKNKIVTTTMVEFEISRQAVFHHIQNLIKEGMLIRSSRGDYKLRLLKDWSKTFSVSIFNDKEDVLWREEIRPQMGGLKDNTFNIWHYGVTEMLNNVLDHSESSSVFIWIKETALSTEMTVADRGIGIFNKIKNAMNLLDERHAVLELTKGKLTTDPQTHSGEGIFFTSRMFDSFSILSGEVFLSHSYGKDQDWILQNHDSHTGTWITMTLKNDTVRTTKEIFDKFSSGDNYGFTKTIVPVELAQYGNEKLISRSQAKRLLERIDRFNTVIFDFAGVQLIGQAFADEIFRIFVNEHPQIRIFDINANDEVKQMINRAISNPS